MYNKDIRKREKQKMMNLLKRADTKKNGVSHYIKLFVDTETGKFSVYANNSNFNWGFIHVFDTKEEAEKDFSDMLEKYNFYKWEVK